MNLHESTQPALLSQTQAGARGEIKAQSGMARAYLRLTRISIAAGLLLPLIVIICSQRISNQPLTSIGISAIPLVGFGWFLLTALAWRGVDRLGGRIQAVAVEQATFLDSVSTRALDWAILGSAALSLFLELSMIRWQGTVFEVFAYYKNFALLACFIGLGLGYALASRESIMLIVVAPALAGQMLLMLFLRHGLGAKGGASLMATPITEQLNMAYSVADSVAHFVAIYSFLSVMFLLTALAFIPIGQLCGRLMMRREGLRAYGFNLLGSLLGVLLIFVASWLWTPPVVWFALSFLALLVFMAHARLPLVAGVTATLAALIILAWPVSKGWEMIYSPYQLLERGSGEKGLMLIRAAGAYYQRVHDLSKTNANRERDINLQLYAQYYELPYNVSGEKEPKVAIVGAGTGNDVAAALRCGAGRVDAIEIDPAIMKLGEIYHPERPYSDSRVRQIKNDARTFLRGKGEDYDLVVYGLLDSHTLLSHASSVRLDSFVYTVEGIREARARLKPGGLISLSFCVLSDELGHKIHRMMTEAFEGKPPLCVMMQVSYDYAVTFLQTKEGDLELNMGEMEKAGFTDVTAHYGNPEIKADVSTDDWPFFYMPRRVYPRSYLVALGMILILSLLITMNFFGQRPAFGNPAFFFLGAGFMLVETKNITEMGLTFGNTWHVIGIVIAGILIMAWLANLCVQRLGIQRPTIPFVLLLAALAGGLAFAKYGGFGTGASGKFATAAVLSLPLFFSGIVFSTLLRNQRNISAVMAFNILGAMLGGVLEYNSMYFGFQFLYVIAIGIYVLAFVSAKIWRPA